MANTRWTPKEEYTLLQGVGIYGLDWFCRKTGRSLDAINAKARRLYGRGGLTRGAFTLRGSARQTGYHTSQLRRAMYALRQKWKRTSPRGSFLIYEEQLEELAAWLKTDYWSARHRLYCCPWCDTDQRPHYAQGLCQRCYQRYTMRLRRGGLLLVAEVKKHLSNGRAPAERILVQLIQCHAVV